MDAAAGGFAVALLPWPEPVAIDEDDDGERAGSQSSEEECQGEEARAKRLESIKGEAVVWSDRAAEVRALHARTLCVRVRRSAAVPGASRLGSSPILPGQHLGHILVQIAALCFAGRACAAQRLALTRIPHRCLCAVRHLRSVQRRRLAPHLGRHRVRSHVVYRDPQSLALCLRARCEFRCLAASLIACRSTTAGR
jgi:hypothetical protein